MHVLISAQNHLHDASGITEYIRDLCQIFPDQSIAERKHFKADYTGLPDSYDIIHLHSVLDAPQYDGLYREDKPTVYFCHSLIMEEEMEDAYHQRKRDAERFLLCNCSHIVFFTAYHKRMACDAYGLECSRCSVIPQGVKHQDMHRMHREGLLYVGRFEKDKGTDDLIEAYRIVRKQRQDISLTMIGGHAAGVNSKEWMKRDALSKYYASARLLVHPSHRESFGRTIMEAINHGCPVLISDIPIHRELYPRAPVFARGGVDSLAKRIIEVYDYPVPLCLPPEMTLTAMSERLGGLHKHLLGQ